VAVGGKILMKILTAKCFTIHLFYAQTKNKNKNILKIFYIKTKRVLGDQILQTASFTLKEEEDPSRAWSFNKKHYIISYQT
jgi:histone deacetylase complex regulatory component SIN3